MDRTQGPDELRRPAPGSACLRRRPRGQAALLRRTTHGEARHHRLGTDQLPLRRLDRGCAPQARVRPVLREELHAFSRPADPAADAPRGAVAGGRTLMDAIWPVLLQVLYLLCAGSALALAG